MAKRLTALGVANLKPRAARYEVPDGSTGLRCVVQPSGTRGWCVRFRRPDKRPAKLTLDSTLSLAALCWLFWKNVTAPSHTTSPGEGFSLVASQPASGPTPRKASSPLLRLIGCTSRRLTELVLK
jgi:hypothetical protein